MARLKAFLVNLATVAVTIGLMLIMAEVMLRFLPVATALPVEPPTDANPIQRYAANQPYTWSFDWNMHHVNRCSSMSPLMTLSVGPIIGARFLQCQRRSCPRTLPST